MALNPKARQSLKAKAHNLKPIVYIGNNGLSANVKNEIDRGLTDHELIKVKISGADRDDRQAMFKEICEVMSAEGVSLVGGVATLFRRSDKV